MKSFPLLKGRKVNTQQEISNLFWIHEIIYPSVTHRIVAGNLLSKKFGENKAVKDLLLPYRPTDITEIHELISRGLVHDGNIYDKVGGKIVGHLPPGNLPCNYWDLEDVVIDIRYEIKRESISTDSTQ